MCIHNAPYSLEHKKLSTTIKYARDNDETVEASYYAAVSWAEQKMELVVGPAKTQELVAEGERGWNLALAQQLAEPELSREARLSLVAVMAGPLKGTIQKNCLSNECGGKQLETHRDHPPPSPAFVCTCIV